MVGHKEEEVYGKHVGMRARYPLKCHCRSVSVKIKKSCQAGGGYSLAKDVEYQSRLCLGIQPAAATARPGRGRNTTPAGGGAAVAAAVASPSHRRPPPPPPRAPAPKTCDSSRTKWTMHEGPDFRIWTSHSYTALCYILAQGKKCVHWLNSEWFRMKSFQGQGLAKARQQWPLTSNDMEELLNPFQYMWQLC